MHGYTGCSGVAAREADFDAVLGMSAFHIRHDIFVDRH